MISTEEYKQAESKPELYTLLNTGRILHLTLKKQWFNLIAKGIKTEEYREIKDYWIKRLKKQSENGRYYEFKEFDRVVFKNGYAKNAPTLIVDFKGVKLDKGYAPWGAIGNEVYFVIELGTILYNSTELKPFT